MHFFKTQHLRLLRLYTVEEGKCSCKKVCHAPGKHPAPWDMQKKNNGVHNAKYDFREEEFEGYNVGVACGNGLLVVDIDPRNNGHITFAELVRGIELPNTWTVETGGGGTHLYYRVPVDCPIRSISFDGVDFQYSGKYVVAPPSTHASGSSYEWVDCDPTEDPIAECPEKLLNWLLLRSERQAYADLPEGAESLKPASFEIPWIHQILEKLPPSIGYENWLAVGMGLHASGLPNAFKIWDEWSATDPNQYREGETSVKWRSFNSSKKRSYRYLFYLAELYGIQYGPENDFFATWTNRVQIVEPESPPEQSLDHGEILTTFMNAALSECHIIIPDFALAVAIQILSASAQGTFRTWTDAPLSLYQWCAAPAGFGKDSYVNFAKATMKAINPCMIAPMFGSVGGLRSCLLAWNSLCAVKDEWHDEFLQFADSRNEYTKALSQDYKVLYNGPEQLDGVVIKASLQPPVVYPSFGLLGFSTVDGLEQCAADGQFLVSGLGSRFSFWLCTTYGNRNTRVPANEADMQSALSYCRSLKSKGITMTGRNVTDILAEIAKVQATFNNSKGPTPSFLPQTHARLKMSLSEGTITFWEDYLAARHEATQKAIGDGEIAFSSLLSRRGQTVARLACIRALSDRREEVLQSDIEWAERLCERMFRDNLRFFGAKTGYSQRDAEQLGKIERVYSVMKRIAESLGKPLLKRDFMKFTNMSQQTLDPILLHLANEGRIEVLDRMGMKIYPEKIQYGQRFTVT